MYSMNLSSTELILQSKPATHLSQLNIRPLSAIREIFDPKLEWYVLL